MAGVFFGSLCVVKLTKTIISFEYWHYLQLHDPFSKDALGEVEKIDVAVGTMAISVSRNVVGR